MIVFLIISFILLFTLFLDKNNNKFNSLLMSISFSFFYLYIITEVLSILNKISVKAIAISWIIYDVLLIILNIVKIYNNKIDLKANIQKINIKQIIKQINFIHIIIAIVMVNLIILGVKTVPYNWDSMTYHLSRIMHWIKNGSINHYATNIVRQITSPPFAEVSNMYIYLLTGQKDVFLNLLQTFSFIINVFMVYFIAKKLGCNKKISIMALFLALSMPIGFAEALSTQVDNFAALWCLIFTYFIIDFLDPKENLKIDRTTILKVACLALSLSFGYLTKPTVLFSDLLFLIYLFIICLIRKDKLVNIFKLSIISMIIVCITITPNIARNIKTFNAISDPIAGSKQMIHTDKPNYFYINFIKNLMWNFTTFVIDNNSTDITNYVNNLAKKYNVNIDDESISEAGNPYLAIKEIRYHQDYAFNPLIVWTLTGAIVLDVLYIVKNKLRGVKEISPYCLIAILSFLIFIAIMRFQVWETRYEISFLLLLCPVIGIILNKVLDNGEYRDYIIGAIVFIALCSIYNQFIYHSEELDDRNNKDNKAINYFTSNLDLYDIYEEIVDIINEKGYNNVGLEVTEDTYEYPLYVMINNLNRLEHVNINNSTRVYYDNEYIPEVIISNISNEDNKIYNEKEYIKCYNRKCYDENNTEYSVYEIVK